jgi:caspase domain-containing protein/ankyrin repeat protein
MKNITDKIVILLLVAVSLLFAGCATPLMDAAKRGDTKEMDMLITAGAQVNESGKYHGTALHYAAYKGHLEAARLLIDKGAAINKQAMFPEDGLIVRSCAPLYLAVLNGDENMAALLLEKGASPRTPVTIKGKEKSTALKLAQDSGNATMVRMLEQQDEKMFAKHAPAAAAVAMLPSVLTTPAGKVTTSDVDDISTIKVKANKNSYAIVIGIEQYRQRLPNADFALHDAQTMTAYLNKVLGYPEENIVTLTNEHAALGDFVKYFERWLPNKVENDSTVFVYYSGHGAPNPKTSDAYLVPYDGDPSFIEETGYSLKRMYAALAKLPAKKVIVALDSCFSGAGGRSVLAKGARPLVMNLKNDVVLSKNMTVLSASSGAQISSTYDEKGHGLFTYFLLKGIKNEDVTRPDGSINLDDLYGYIKPQVERIARRQFNNEQTPQIIEPKGK